MRLRWDLTEFREAGDGESINSANWIEAFARVATVFSGGAWIDFTADALVPGDMTERMVGDVMHCAARSSAAIAGTALERPSHRHRSNSIDSNHLRSNGGWLAGRAWRRQS